MRYFDDIYMNNERNDHMDQLDRTDVRILRALQQDGRLSNADLAKRVNASPATCHRRTQRLMDEGYIADTRAHVAPDRVGLGAMALVGVVRAEFLRARNLEYVRAAKALGVSNLTIMFRHMLPNAMVATLTMLPFVITGTISLLAGLDFLGFGLPSSSPSLGELTLQAKQNLQAPWLAFTAFFAFAIMLSLLVFIFEGVRDAFDPRKTFQ